jgi:hypothetical protein
MIVCEWPDCGREFDPIAHRWLCPFCKHKADCCVGAPLPPRKEGSGDA